MLNLEIPLIGIGGDSVAGAYTFDTCETDTNVWTLRTSFIASASSLEKSGAHPALAHRIRVEFCVENALDASDLLCRGPIRVSLERKWRAEGFSLEVDAAVQRAGSSPVRTGLDQAMVTSAIGGNCFGDGNPAPESSSFDDDATGSQVVCLPEGVSVQLGPAHVVVRRKFADGAAVMLRRDFDSCGALVTNVQTAG